MPNQIIEALVAGGRASAAPPLGPQLGPLGVNIGMVIAEINKKTASFAGMQVPVKISVNPKTKKFEVTVGTPPASALIKKEAGIEKGSGNPLMDKVADLRIEQIIKISQMKQDSLLGKDSIARCKEIIGTCHSMGVLVEGNSGQQTIMLINQGQFVDKIKSGKTELSAAELKALEAERKKLQEEIEKRKAEFTALGKQILASMEGKSKGEIKAKLLEAKIPDAIIKELMPATDAVAAGGAQATPGAAGAKPAETKAAAEKKK